MTTLKTPVNPRLLKIKNILQNANIKCDDNIDANTLLIYFNQGITRLNVDCNLKLPTVLMEDVADNVYEISDEEFVINMVSNILCSFIAYCIQQNEGYANNENTFFSEFLSTKMQFNMKFKHLIKEEYKLNDVQDGSVRDGQITPNRFFKRTKLW